MLPMMRLEDAISTTSYIRSGAEDVRGCAWGGGDKNKVTKHSFVT